MKSRLKIKKFKNEKLKKFLNVQKFVAVKKEKKKSKTENKINHKNVQKRLMLGARLINVQ